MRENLELRRCLNDYSLGAIHRMRCEHIGLKFTVGGFGGFDIVWGIIPKISPPGNERPRIRGRNGQSIEWLMIFRGLIEHLMTVGYSVGR